MDHRRLGAGPGRPGCPLRTTLRRRARRVPVRGHRVADRRSCSGAGLLPARPEPLPRVHGAGLPGRDALLLVERHLVRKVVQRMRVNGRLLHRVIAVGGPSGISEVVDALRRSQHVGYQVIGACVPDGLPAGTPALRCAASSAGSRKPDGSATRSGQTPSWSPGVGTPPPASSGGSPGAWRSSSIDLVVVPSLTDVAGPADPDATGGRPAAPPRGPAAGGRRGRALEKRLFDIAGAGLALLILSPLMLVVALIDQARGPRPGLLQATADRT